MLRRTVCHQQHEKRKVFQASWLMEPSIVATCPGRSRAAQSQDLCSIAGFFLAQESVYQ